MVTNEATKQDFYKGGEFEENQEEEFLNFSGKKIER